MKTTSLSALVAAGLLMGGLSATNAYAADLGGNCCADLEERIAELEATTVRKGNRKVSLTISGWVGEQVMWWDDGEESNVYVTGLGHTLASHFKLTGEAKIREGLSAGYVLQIEASQADPLLFLNQNTDEGTFLNTFQSYWFLKDDRYGKVSVGLLSPASDNTAILVDGSGSLVPANWVLFDNRVFFLRLDDSFTTPTGLPIANIDATLATALVWGDLASCSGGFGVAGDCGGFAGPTNAVRYDTPTYMGFSASADWGEDDFWDVAVRWSGEFNSIKAAVAASYFDHVDENGRLGEGANPGDYFQIGAYVQHVPTGLFAYGAFGTDDVEEAVVALGGAEGADGKAWYFKAGVRQRWTPLGHTVLFGEYGLRDDLFSQRLADNGIDGSELEQFGAGLVQEVDAAAMSFWLVYRHFEGEVESGGAEFEFDDFDLVKFGALINF